MSAAGVIIPLPGFLDAWAKSRKRGNISEKGGRLSQGASNQANNLLNKPDYLHQQHSSGVNQKLEQSFKPVFTQTELERLCEALRAIPADLDYHQWVTVGMALRELRWEQGGDDVGFELWNSWSAVGVKYPGRGVLETKWETFGKGYSGARVTVASVYELAKQHGHVPSSGVGTVSTNNINGSHQGVHALPLSLTTNPIRWLDIDRFGNPKATCANTRVALQYMGVQCKYDLFHKRQYVGGKVIEQWAGEIADDCVLALREMIRGQWIIDPPTQVVLDALMMECLKHAYDPINDYLDGAQAKWDKTPRLQTWLADYMGAAASPLNSMIGGLSLVAAVRRARQPGVKFDHCIVLEGQEGLGKSSAVCALAGEDNFSDQEILTLDERRQQEALQGVWLYEIAELAGMHRTDVEKVKTFITRTTDRARPAYGRRRVDFPRRCVFFASTNNQDYLKSQTGNRRFWPVACSKVSLDALRNIRDQLWAEAAMIEASGVSLFLPPALWGHAQALQDSRMEYEPWQELIEEHMTPPWLQVFEGVQRITTYDLMNKILKIPEERWSNWHTSKLRYLMNKLGWEGPHLIRVRLLKDDPATVPKRGYSKVVTGK